jgi:acyl carrier protein
MTRLQPETAGDNGLPSMKQAEITAALTDLFRELLDNPLMELKLTDKERDIPGFDSAKKVHLLISVEERFGIRLRNTEINSLRSIADWARVIETHCGAAT